MAYIISSGESSEGIILNYDDSMTVLEGGIAYATTVNSGGWIYVSSGGTANSTTVRSDGNLKVSSGGTANSTMISSGGYLYVFSGGMADSTTVRSDGYLYVFSGGMADSTTVRSGGRLYVSSGGTADHTTVGAGGNLKVSSGGTADHTTVNSGGRMYVSSGGTADHTEIKNSGWLDIYSSGTVNSTTVSSGGTVTGITLDSGQILTVNSGGIASNVTVNSGGIANGITVSKNQNLTVNPGGILSNTSINSGCSMLILSGRTATNTTVNSGGLLCVSSGGTANSTMISSGGVLHVSSGGNADSVVVFSGAYLYVSSGGTATNIDWNPWFGKMSLDDGAYTTFVPVYSGVYFSGNQWSSGRVSYEIIANYLYSMNVMESGQVSRAVVIGENIEHIGSCGIWNGGIMERTSVFQYGTLDVFSGGMARINYVGVDRATQIPTGSGGRMLVHRSGLAISTTIGDEGEVFVSSGGLAICTTVETGGSIFISNGGTAMDVVENGGCVEVSDGANVSFRSNTINNCRISSGQSATIHSGTTVFLANVSSASLNVFEGGIVKSATMGDLGQIIVSGGTANNIGLLGSKRAAAGLAFYAPSCVVFSGGTVNRTDVDVGCLLLSGGIANSTTVDEYGELYIFNGGTANDTTLLDGIPAYGTRGGLLMMVYDGTANNTVVGSGALMHVCSTAAASGITIHSGGTLTTCSGGRLTGYLTFEKGATVSANEAAIVFDLTGAAAGKPAFISDLSLVNGNPAYAVIVSDHQEEGVYALADGAGDFDGTITVTNSFGKELGVLSVGNTADISGVQYTLFHAGEELSLAVGCDPSSGLIIVSSGLVLTDETESVNSGESYIRTTVGKGGVFDVSDGGVANGVVVSSGGSVAVENGVVNSVGVAGGSMVVSDGGAVNDVKVSSGGFVNVESGGSVNDAAVYSFGSMFVSSGAVVSGAVVCESGYLAVSSGGTITGEMRLTGSVFVSSGGIVCLDLTRMSSSADEPLIEDLNLVRGKPDYRLAVSDTTQGFFRLAGNSPSSSNPDFMVVDSSGNSMGRTSQKTIDDVVFSTFVSSGVLVANIGSGAIVLSTEDKQRTVLSGEVYSGTTVRCGGLLIVRPGGTATEIVENGGYVSAYNGAEVAFASNTFSGLILSPRGGRSASIHSGTTGVFTTIESGVYLDIFSSGLAINTIISRGNVRVSSGGIASGATMLGGGLTIEKGGSAADVSVNHFVFDGGYSESARLSVEAGGEASRVMVNSGGTLFVSRGGNAIDVTVNYGGSANGITLKDGNRLTVSSGGRGSNIVVSNGGTLFCFDGRVNADVSSGGLVTGSFIGRITVQEDGLASDVTICSNGKLSVQMGGTATSTTVGFGGSLFLEYGCTADFTTLNSGGSVSFYSVMNSTTINSGGELIIERGRIADNTILNSGGTLSVLSGGTASVAISNPWNVGTIVSNSGATVLRQYDAKIYLRDEDTGEITGKTDTMESMCICSRKTALVCSGGTANSTAVSDEGYLVIYSGGTANNTTVGSLGYFMINSGGTADNTTVSGGGLMYLFYGGTADNTTVSGSGSFCVSSGTAINTTVSSGGSLIVSDGGKLTGKTDIESGAKVFAKDGAILDFDLMRTSAGAAALVNDLSGIQGVPLYTLTVNDEWKPGCCVYALADGAAWFDDSITVVNTTGAALGTLMVGETVRIGYDDYTLNLTDGALSVTVEVPDLTPTSTVGTSDKVSWDATGAEQYVVEYSTDGFVHTFQVDTAGNALAMLDLPAGTYQWRVKADANSDWAVGDEIVSDNDNTPKVLQSDGDGNDDLFFAAAADTWSNLYYAKHVGSMEEDWNGTGEFVSAGGKGRIQNLFFGSADPNVLCLTDGDNGDGLFLDDVYTELPEEVEANTARLLQIHEIRAGAGDDIVDMTSQRFEYIGDGLTIRGGEGNDTIWANKGDNFLFGDAGNDRIVGASGYDVIAGGIGNDRMHGGGGNDVFTFCDNWDVDTVEQLATGTVTLWFASGSMENWDEATLTYSDGENSVKVSGVTADKVMLKFGDDGSDLYAALTSMGAFFDATTERVFEESGKGILASL